MSAYAEDIDDHGGKTTGNKRRKLARNACDMCRKRKCDGQDMANNICTGCLVGNFPCTYTPSEKHSLKEYVQSLEDRLRRMEELLEQSRSNNQSIHEAGSPSNPNGNSQAGSSSSHSAPSPHNTSSANHSSPRSLFTSGDSSSSEESDNEAIPLEQLLAQLELNPNTPRIAGATASTQLLRRAAGVTHKIQLDGSSGDFPLTIFLPDGRPMMRRPEYWKMDQWEKPAFGLDDSKATPNYSLPPADLLPVLVDAYFEHVNIILPVLHRPTFDRALAHNDKWKDDGFVGVVLAVCAIGAAYLDDPRVLVDGVGRSAGWKWFTQVQIVRKTLLTPPTLYDIQVYCLAAIFLCSASDGQAYWTLLGTGIRLAQDVGAHRRKVYKGRPTVHNELWKRAFWVLVSLDKSTSWLVGRPSAIQEEDMDIDLPLEVDDEYWEHPDPDQCFKQPPDKPAQATAFVQLIKLHQILASILRTVYSIKKSKIVLGFVGPDWEEKTVAQINSTLNEWLDALPDHLRWEPNREDETHFHQSAMLFKSYCLSQIVLHQPFVPFIGKQHNMTVPAVAMCMNAARSCARVLEVHSKRRKGLIPFSMTGAWQAGNVLVLAIWNARKSGLALDPVKEMEDVNKCLDVLKLGEQRWTRCGRYWDKLSQIASVQMLSDAPNISGPSLKRGRADLAYAEAESATTRASEVGHGQEYGQSTQVENNHPVGHMFGGYPYNQGHPPAYPDISGSIPVGLDASTMPLPGDPTGVVPGTHLYDWDLLSGLSWLYPPAGAQMDFADSNSNMTAASTSTMGGFNPEAPVLHPQFIPQQFNPNLLGSYGPDSSHGNAAPPLAPGPEEDWDAYFAQLAQGYSIPTA